MTQKDYKIRDISYYFMENKEIMAKWPKEVAAWGRLAFQFIAFMPGQDSYRSASWTRLNARGLEMLKVVGDVADDAEKVNQHYAEALRLAATEVKRALRISKANNAEEMKLLQVMNGIGGDYYQFRELGIDEAVDKEMLKKMKKGKKFFVMFDSEGISDPKIKNERGINEYYWSSKEDRYVHW